jgi:hypothetical protein
MGQTFWFEQCWILVDFPELLEYLTTMENTTPTEPDDELTRMVARLQECGMKLLAEKVRKSREDEPRVLVVGGALGFPHHTLEFEMALAEHGMTILELASPEPLPSREQLAREIIASNRHQLERSFLLQCPPPIPDLTEPDFYEVEPKHPTWSPGFGAPLKSKGKKKR